MTTNTAHDGGETIDGLAPGEASGAREERNGWKSIGAVARRVMRGVMLREGDHGEPSSARERATVTTVSR